jgi:hypothetical protein
MLKRLELAVQSPFENTYRGVNHTPDPAESFLRWTLSCRCNDHSDRVVEVLLIAYALGRPEVC